MAQNCGFLALLLPGPGTGSAKVGRTAVDVAKELIVDRLGEGHLFRTELGEDQDVPEGVPATFVVVRNTAPGR